MVTSLYEFSIYRYSGTLIQQSAKRLAKFVCKNKVSLYQGSFSYILTVYTVEPRYKEPLYSKVLGIMNDCV